MPLGVRFRPPPKVLGEDLGPPGDPPVRLPGPRLKGAALVAHKHQRVPPEGGGQGPQGHGGAYGQGVLPVQPPGVEGKELHLGKPLPVQGPPQQIDQARSPAGVRRLGDEHGGVVRVVPPGAQGGDHLSGNQDEGVAEIVVHIPKAQRLRVPVRVLQDDGPAAGRLEGPAQQGPVMVQQRGNQQSLHGTPPF